MKTLVLPERLDSRMAPRLYRQLAEHFCEELKLDASKMRHLGTLGLQVLLSAAQSWRAKNVHFDIQDITPEARAQLAILGIRPSQLMDQSHDN